MGSHRGLLLLLRRIGLTVWQSLDRHARRLESDPSTFSRSVIAPQPSTMSSFRRLRPSSTPAPPVGSLVFPSLALPHLSTGVASLDDVLAPGQPLSSTLLVRTPDGHSAWAKLLERYWIAQGLTSGQGVVVVAGPGEGKELAQGLMWDANAPKAASGDGGEASGAESEGEDVLGDDEVDANRTKIAWRYGGMSKFKTTVDSKSSSGRSSFFHPSSPA